MIISKFNLAFISFMNEIVSVIKITIINLFFFTFLDFYYFQSNKGYSNRTFCSNKRNNNRIFIQIKEIKIEFFVQIKKIKIESLFK